MKRKAYSEYKQSGVDWIETVPADWPVKRLRFGVKTNPSKTETNELSGETAVSFVPMEAVGEYGGLRLDQTKALDDVSAGYTYFLDGDVVVAKITPCFENGKGAIAEGLESGIGFGTTELHVLRSGPDVDREYLFYLTLSHAFRNIGASFMYGAGGQKRVPDDFIRDFRHPLPPIGVQRAIASFLDRETARIDALIAKKERQIELLQEKRAALISHVVTKGLDPNVKMKDSSIEWLGQIPAHWETKRVKRLGVIRYGLGEPPAYVDVGMPFIRATDIKQGKVNLDEVKRVHHDDIPWSRRPLLNLNEILVVRSGAYTGDSAIVTESVAGCIAGYDMVLTIQKGHAPFIAWVLLSKYMLRGQIYLERLRAAQPHLNAEELGGFIVVMPPLDEQRVIADLLNCATARIDAISGMITESIAMLHEHRTAVISAAVTGKIDVRQKEAVAAPVQKANVYFRRAVLGAEIVHRLHGDETFGRVKLQKILYLSEYHLGMELSGEFKRDAAGPFDNRMMRSIEGQLERQQWYRRCAQGQRSTYVPLAKAGQHQTYFDRYWNRDVLDALIALVRPMNTEQIEIVATLYAAWNDLLIEGRQFTDDDILREVRANWHKSKERFTEDRLRVALVWMRDHGLVPQGRGKATTRVRE